MWEEVKKLIKLAFETYPKRKFGFLIGIIFGVAIINFGFFQTLFAFFCGVIGLYIGSRFDDGDDLIDATLKALEEAVPDRWKYWKYFN